jgi:hypothetical protein
MLKNSLAKTEKKNALNEAEYRLINVKNQLGKFEKCSQ